MRDEREMRATRRVVDVDDLLDSDDVATLLGLSTRRAVSVYRARYSGFPAPIIDKGHCVMWLRTDIEAWVSGRR